VKSDIYIYIYIYIFLTISSRAPLLGTVLPRALTSQTKLDKLRHILWLFPYLTTSIQLCFAHNTENVRGNFPILEIEKRLQGEKAVSLQVSGPHNKTLQRSVWNNLCFYAECTFFLTKENQLEVELGSAYTHIMAGNLCRVLRG
jgi:hypothetical protein